MVKAIVIKGPKGYNMIGEVDYLYPLPDSVASLIPKKKTVLKPVVVAKPQPPPPPPAPIQEPEIPVHYPEHDHHPVEENEIPFNHLDYQQHPDLFVPDSGWRSDPNLAQLPDVPLGKEVPTTLLHRRIWSPAAVAGAAQSTVNKE